MPVLSQGNGDQVRAQGDERESSWDGTTRARVGGRGRVGNAAGAAFPPGNTENQTNAREGEGAGKGAGKDAAGQAWVAGRCLAPHATSVAQRPLAVERKIWSTEFAHDECHNPRCSATRTILHAKIERIWTSFYYQSTNAKSK